MAAAVAERGPWLRTTARQSPCRGPLIRCAAIMFVASSWMAFLDRSVSVAAPLPASARRRSAGLLFYFRSLRLRLYLKRLTFHDFEHQCRKLVLIVVPRPSQSVHRVAIMILQAASQGIRQHLLGQAASKCPVFVFSRLFNCSGPLKAWPLGSVPLGSMANLPSCFRQAPTPLKFSQAEPQGVHPLRGSLRRPDRTRCRSIRCRSVPANMICSSSLEFGTFGGGGGGGVPRSFPVSTATLHRRSARRVRVTVKMLAWVSTRRPAAMAGRIHTPARILWPPSYCPAMP